ncbi:MAG: phenylacetate--CoA ligase [Endomicrobiaceae bacterium]|nr:phenylacetate--CoA ligase [Endomicrobiaceae bacterium]MDD3923254.1 phenylacetate--CoA ligase [Endomicrobiaceae bacterium]
MIFNEAIECASKENLKNLQSERLAKLVQYVYKNSPVYKKKIDDLGINPQSIKTIDDITKLPFTPKEDLRDFYPFGLFSSNIKDVAEIHVSSGTTGNPTVVGYTKKDLDLWSDVSARSIACAGGNKGDMIQVAYGYGLFTGGLGLHYGALHLGLTVIPMSSGQSKRQVKLMQDFKPRLVACTPSYCLYLAEEMRDMGIDPKTSNWEIGIFGAEPWSESIRKNIENTLNISATDIYGLSEIIGPGVAQECTYKEGLHIWSDVFYPEIIDPDTNLPVPEGQQGELVITTLTKQAIPLLRYRTRDIASLTYETCKCGRTVPRISKIRGRTDDMIIVRGINVFPTQVEHALLQIDGTLPNYLIIVDRQGGTMDTVEIWVEVDEKIFSDELNVMSELKNKIKRVIETTLGIGATIKLVEPKTITRSEGKSTRVIDRRSL